MHVKVLCARVHCVVVERAHTRLMCLARRFNRVVQSYVIVTRGNKCAFPMAVSALRYTWCEKI